MGDKSTDGLGTKLQETKVKVKPPMQCATDTARLVKYNPQSMICAHMKGTDACNVSFFYAVL